MLIAVAVSMLGVLIDTSYTPRPSNLSILKRLAKATQPHSHRSSISRDRLQLSYSKLGMRGLFIWHFQQADLESAPQHDSLSSSSAMLDTG
jgi:hypothetical protein